MPWNVKHDWVLYSFNNIHVTTYNILYVNITNKAYNKGGFSILVKYIINKIIYCSSNHDQILAVKQCSKISLTVTLLAARIVKYGVGVKSRRSI